MKKRRGQLFNDWDGNTTFWQCHNNPAEYERQPSHEQASHDADDTWIILLSIFFTIGFLFLLAATTVWNIF